MNQEERALGTWVKLSRAYSTVHKHIYQDIRSYGLTFPQFAVLECLGHKGELTLGSIGQKVLMAGGNITVVVDNLEKEGLVKRVPSSKDRRVKLASLTPKGEALFKEIFPSHQSYVTQLMGEALSPEEQEQLSVLLKKMGLALSKT